jgi:N-methylhydantoinase B
MGARESGDGLSTTAFPSGIRGVPAEVIENISPVLMHRREIRPDSEGPGRHRGGFGQEMEIGVRSPSPWVLSAMYDRTRCPAQGVNGGSPGAPGTVRTSGGKDLHPKRQQRIDAAERVILSLPGGGGFGAPAQRDPAEVARDATDGLVSVERARQVYGVALTETARSGVYDVDAEETARLRAETEPPTGAGP